MLNKSRITIDLSHPNTRNAESFLNSWEEPFLPEEEGTGKFVFRSAISQTMVELLFFNSYEEANSYGAEHFDPINEKRKWSVNGAFLFVVSGDNVNKVTSLVSHFAGRRE